MRDAYGILLSASNNLALSYFKNFLNAVLIPVDYTRTREIPALIEVSGILKRKSERLKVLDISSPQILGVSLSMQSPDWDITYVNPFPPEIADMQKRAGALNLRNLKIIQADITRPETLKGLSGFDYVFSCSVFEHIHPEHGGDALAAANLSGLLKPGGLFAFSVPYYKKAFNEYVEGDAYAVKAEGARKTFFQRFYDEKTLQEQIIGPSGFQAVSRRFIGERFYHANDITRRMAHRIGFGTKALLLGRLFKRISGVFMEESGDAALLKKPYLAIYALRKAQ